MVNKKYLNKLLSDVNGLIAIRNTFLLLHEELEKDKRNVDNQMLGILFVRIAIDIDHAASKLYINNMVGKKNK